MTCTHCYHKQDSQVLDFDKAVEFINNLPDDFEYVIHGGEPYLVDHNKLKQFISRLNKQPSITTNLVYNIEDIDWFKMFNGIATSWNYGGRFRDFDILQWSHNINLLKQHGHEVTVLITMTKELVQRGVNGFIESIYWWADDVDHIVLEYQTGGGPNRQVSEDFYYTVRDTLTKYDQKYNKIIKANSYGCSKNVLTLNPDLTISGCPNKGVLYGNTSDSFDTIINSNACKHEQFLELKNGIFPCYAKGYGL